jgi:hypothetical protein
LEGIVVRKKGGLRFVLTMDLIMKSIAVEVDGAELEPVNPEPYSGSGGNGSQPSCTAAGDQYGWN